MSKEASICLSVPIISYLYFQKLSKKNYHKLLFFPSRLFLTALSLGKQSLDQLKNFFDDRWRSAPETKRRIIVSKINSSLFTCGRRPAGLLVTPVVVVVVGGGNNFYTWAFQRAHVWF